MRFRTLFIFVSCLLSCHPARGEALKFKLSGRANTKTVLVEASGSVTATNSNNVAQTESWNGYTDFWKSTVDQTFGLTGGITLKNETSGQSRGVTALSFSNLAGGDGFSMASNLIMGGTNHRYTLSGAATFQLQPSQTFGQLFGGGTYSTGSQNPPLGPGPVLEIEEALPGDIQVQLVLPGGGYDISTATGRSFEVVLRITNVGAGFAENVPYTMTLPAEAYITEDSPRASLSGTLSLLKAGESADLTYYLNFTGGGTHLYDAVEATSDFADADTGNNSASVTIREIDFGLETPAYGNHFSAAFAPPGDFPETITPGTQVTLPVTFTGTGDGPTLIHFIAPEDVFIDDIEYEGGLEPPGLWVFVVEDFGIAVLPESPAGTVFTLGIRLHGQNGAGGNLTVANAPGTAAETIISYPLNFGAGSGSLHECTAHVFGDTNDNDFFDIGEPNVAGYDVLVDDGENTFTLKTDPSGFIRAYLPPGAATLTIPGVTEPVSFTVPDEDSSVEVGLSGLETELEVALGWDTENRTDLIITGDGLLPDATLTITNNSNVPAVNVPVTVYYQNYPDDGDDEGFAEIENPLTGEKTAFSSSFIVASVPANTTVGISVPFHRLDEQMDDIFGTTITIRVALDWSDPDAFSNQDDIRIEFLPNPPHECEWTSTFAAPVPAGSPFVLNGKLISLGGSGTGEVLLDSTEGRILSLTVPGAATPPVNQQNGDLWRFTAPYGAPGQEIPFSAVVVVPSNGAANFTIRVLSTGPGLAENSAILQVTGDATPTVLVSGQVFFDANANGMADGSERFLPNWPLMVTAGVANPVRVVADAAGKYGVFVPAGGGPGQVTPGAGAGGAPGPGFGFTPLPGADVDLDPVVGPLIFAGRAYVDQDSDAVYTPGTDLPFPGLTAYLGMSAATGQTTTTDADGRYLFTLPPDTPGFALNPAETGGVARAHIIGLSKPEGFTVAPPVFGVHYVPDFTAGILPLVSTPLNALDFVMGVEPNLVSFDHPSSPNPKIRWPKRLGSAFIPEFFTSFTGAWGEITAGRSEDANFYYANLPVTASGTVLIRLTRPIGGP